MAQGLIYMVDAEGALRRMVPTAPDSEDRMQDLVARYPELISDGDGDLLLIRREHPIADSDEASGRWSLDHLFVTRNSVPVLVELKRAVDTRLRREVVGQILDYAANATAYWQAGRIADSFAVTAKEAGVDPDITLKNFIGEQDPTAFWQQVDANFTAGRIKLVIVADEIPRELARVIEFLNDQMHADVRAVELRWFAGEGGVITLSPRLIGETERAATAKGPGLHPEPISLEQWLERHVAPAGAENLAGARAYIGLVEALGGYTGVASPRQGSVYAAFKGGDGKLFYPLHLWADTQLVSLSFQYIHQRPGLVDPSVRQRLLDGLVAIVGPMTTANIKGFPSFKVALLADARVAERVKEWLMTMLEVAR